MNEKISANRILCEADRSYNKADDMHLRTSIRNRLDQGLKPLLQPIALKKTENNPDYDYMVDDGRRRYRALTGLGITEFELGQEAILIDGDSGLNAYLANQHTDLSLAEEITKLSALQERFPTQDGLAAEIGRSPRWVARRLNLRCLSDLWKKAMESKTFGYMSVSHYETIATFPPEIQDDIFDFIRSTRGRDLKTMSVGKFSQTLYDEFATRLSSLPWHEEGCGECPACRDRKESGFLFVDLLPEPRCMNREYLEKKRKEYVAALAAQEPETVLVSQNYSGNGDETQADENDPLAEHNVLGAGDWSETDNTEGVPAIIADGPRAGSKILIRQPKASGVAAPKQSKTLAERKEARNRQRKRKAIDMLMTAIKEGKTVTPSRKAIFLMIACKGVKAVCGSHFDYATKQLVNPLELPDKIMSYCSLDAADQAEGEKLNELLWKQVCENVFSELTYGQSGTEEPRWTDAELIAGLIRFDLSGALEEATIALPDAKSWKALEKIEEKERLKAEQEAA